MFNLSNILASLKALVPVALLGFFEVLKIQKDHAVAKEEVTDLKIKEMEASSEIVKEHLNESSDAIITEYLSKFDDPDKK
jgi:hypothetical protein